jgi:hypothetical protein
MALISNGNDMIQTPGTATMGDLIGSVMMLLANETFQQAMVQVQGTTSQTVVDCAKAQDMFSDATIAANQALYTKYIDPILAEQKNGGSGWTPSGTDSMNENLYNTGTQQNNSTGQAENQSVSTMESGGTSVLQSEQQDASTANTQTADCIDTALINMRLN